MNFRRHSRSHQGFWLSRNHPYIWSICLPLYHCCLDQLIRQCCFQESKLANSQQVSVSSLIQVSFSAWNCLNRNPVGPKSLKWWCETYMRNAGVSHWINKKHLQSIQSTNVCLHLISFTYTFIIRYYLFPFSQFPFGRGALCENKSGLLGALAERAVRRNCLASPCRSQRKGRRSTCRGRDLDLLIASDCCYALDAGISFFYCLLSTWVGHLQLRSRVLCVEL